MIWAKSADGLGHGLLAHMLDVAAVAEAIVSRESEETRLWAAACFGLVPESVPRWVAAFSGLHDFGKAIPGFQAKWPEGQTADMAAGLGFKPFTLSATRHDLASAAFLRTDLGRHFPGAGWAQAVSQALGAHHGYFP